MLNPICAPPPRDLCTKEAAPFLSLERWKNVELTAGVHSIEKLEAAWCMQLRICRLGLTLDPRRRPPIHVLDRRQHRVVNRQPNVNRAQTQVVLEL